MQALNDDGNIPELMDILKICSKGDPISGRDCFKIFDGITFNGPPNFVFMGDAECSSEPNVIGSNLKGTNNGWWANTEATDRRPACPRFTVLSPMDEKCRANSSATTRDPEMTVSPVCS